jgi:hypothetical protein
MTKTKVLGLLAWRHATPEMPGKIEELPWPAGFKKTSHGRRFLYFNGLVMGGVIERISEKVGQPAFRSASPESFNEPILFWKVGEDEVWIHLGIGTRYCVISH